jgi:predicted  nucleic acid-binding Zn-ribbon protein
MSWEQVTGGIGTAGVALALGVLTYRRSRAVDKISAQSGVATESRAGTAQVIDGLNRIIDTLQEDNKEWRAGFRELTIRLEVMAAERDKLRQEIARLRRKYGDNSDTPASGMSPTT